MTPDSRPRGAGASRPSRRAVLWLSLLLLCGGGLPAARARNAPLTTPELLVDLARDYGLNRAGRQTPADVLHVKTLLRAAVRLNPRLGEAYAWLYELARLAGDSAEATRMLDKLVAVDPGHAGAVERWIDASLAPLQTVEQRRDWLLTALRDENWTSEVRALLHVQLARLMADGFDLEAARAQLGLARQHNPLDPEIPAVELMLLGRDFDPVQGLRVALAALTARPVQPALVWPLANFLDERGLSEAAERFYQHAATIDPLPIAARRLQLARHALARGQAEEAIRLARLAAAADPGDPEIALSLCWLLDHANQGESLEDLKEQLSAQFARIQDPARSSVNALAQAAWYYTRFDVQPVRALALIEAAARRAPDDAFVRRVLGWVQALNHRADEAKRTLAPIAATDALAAYRLAVLLRDAGDDAAAQRVLAELRDPPAFGPAHELLRTLGLPESTQQAQAQLRQRLTELLNGFNAEVLAFANDPARFLTAEVTVASPSAVLGEPWWVDFSLTSRASFPITLGPDWMCNPVFLISLRCEGDRTREMPFGQTVVLDRYRVLAPGQTVRLRRTIDVGAARQIARITPQQLQRVALVAILDPVNDGPGRWRPAAGGQALRPVYFNRIPADVSRQSVHALFRAYTGAEAVPQLEALESLALLLGEHQRAALGQLAYRPQPIENERFQQALLNGLYSESWELRARTLDALVWVGLDRGLLNAARLCLNHENWVVRLFAIRLLTREGAPFLDTARAIAERDSDELVRDLAHSVLLSAEIAASQPATSPTE